MDEEWEFSLEFVFAHEPFTISYEASLDKNFFFLPDCQILSYFFISTPEFGNLGQKYRDFDTRIRISLKEQKSEIDLSIFIYLLKTFAQRCD